MAHCMVKLIQKWVERTGENEPGIKFDFIEFDLTLSAKIFYLLAIA